MVKSCWGAINQRAPCTLEVSASDGLDVLVKRSDRSLLNLDQFKRLFKPIIYSMIWVVKTGNEVTGLKEKFPWLM